MTFIHFLLFLTGFFWVLMERLVFEKHGKDKDNEDYQSLFRLYNSFSLVLFLALAAECIYMNFIA